MPVQRSCRPAGATRSIIFALLFVCVGSVSQAAFAASIVNVWNGLAQGNGSYLNATNIAQLLVFTNSTINADNEIIYLETVNLGTSPAGAAVFSAFHNAPKTSILGNISLGVGTFNINSAQIDLAGSFARHSDGQPPASARLVGNALTVDVLSNNADLQQAIYLTQTSAGVSTINAAFGTATGMTFDFDTAMILSGGLLSGAVAMNHADSSLELQGYGFELDTGGGFLGVGSGAITALSGQLKGFLNSGDPFNVSFTQGLSGQISLLGAVPVPASAWLLGSALGLLGWMRRTTR